MSCWRSWVGACARTSPDKGELPDESLLAMAPISVRSESEKGSQGNQVSSMVVSVASNVADPLERLQAVRESTHQSKEFTQRRRCPNAHRVLAVHPRRSRRARRPHRVTLRDGQPCRPDRQLRRHQRARTTRAALLRRRQAGDDVRDGPDRRRSRAHAPGHQLRDELVIAVTSCREMLPDPAVYAQCLQDSYDELAEATAARTPPPKRPARRRAPAKKKARRS